MQAALTGASGFLGLALARALRPAASVLAIEGDVRDEKTYAGLPRVDVAWHLAAISRPRESIDDPETTWTTNVDGTRRLLDWARRVDVGRVVLVSSAHVYGKARTSPIDETHPLEPVSPYGASKAAAEALLRAWSASYGLEGVIVRPFNVYGPGQRPGFLIPDVLDPMREGRVPRLGDPRPVRDFTYVDDAAEMLRLAGTHPEAKGHAFNLGSGAGHSVREVATLAAEVSGTGLVPVFQEGARPGDVAELVVDNRLAKRVLGWAPRVDLREGLRRTWAQGLKA